jgi:hypothetical protein
MKQGVAMPLLNLYRSDRALQGSLAGEELQNQHAFAQQKLQAEIAKNIAETMISGTQHGALDVLRGTPGTAGMFAGGNAAAYDQAQDLFGRKTLAGIVKETGQGAQALTESGNPLVPGAVNSVLGGPYSAAGVPLKLQVQAANAAAKGAGTPKGPNTSVSIQNPWGGESATISGHNQEEVAANTASQMDIWRRAATGGAANAAGGSGGSTSAQPNATAGNTKPAQANTARAAPQPVINSARDVIHQRSGQGDPAAADLKKGFVGGQPNLQIHNGRVLGQGGSGKWYDVGSYP